MEIRSLLGFREYFPVEISKDLNQLRRLDDPTDDVVGLERRYETDGLVEIFNTQEDFALSLCEKNVWVDRREYKTMYLG